MRRRRSTAVGILEMREVKRRYDSSEKGKACTEKYRQSDTYKVSLRKYRTSKKGKLTIRNSMLQRKYGITLETYNKMLKHGNGGCWICHRKPKPGKNLNVDHQHLSKVEKKAGVKFGKVRGLLDFFCNKYLIGRRKTEHANLFENAAKYLRSPIDWRNT